MKKKTINKITLFTALGMGVVLLASCTANFCTTGDKARIMYTYDTGTCHLMTKDEYESATKEEGWKEKHPSISFKQLAVDFKGTAHELPEEVTNDNIYFVQYYNEDTKNYQSDYNSDPSKTITDVVSTAKTNKIIIPSQQYWFEMDKITIAESLKLYKNDTRTGVEHIAFNDLKIDDLVTKQDKGNIKVLDAYGYCKFGSDNNKEDKELWSHWDAWTQELRESLGVNNCPNKDFTTYYKSVINAKVNNIRSCITISNGIYGNFGYNHSKIDIKGINWSQAFGKGFLEGLLVFPVAAMVDIFSHYFGMGGWGQLSAILLVTFIVRSILLLVSLKSTIGQQKMTMLQPELAKIQAKYPNANTNMAQKQRLSQEQMALYKKNGINPLGTLLVLIVQFPLFIGVWGAMQGSAALATDAVWNLHLSDSIWNTLLQFSSGWKGNTNGCWTAFTLIIIMSIAQFVAMQLPQWIQKYKSKKNPQAKLTANPAANKTQKQMKWFGYIMLAMIIIMGFTLPAGMGVYWLAGALFSIVQTIVMQLAMGGTFKRFGKWVAHFFKKKNTIDVDTTK